MSDEERKSAGDEEEHAGDERRDRTFTEEQSALFGRDAAAAPDKTRRRTPGTQTVPPTDSELKVDDGSREES